MKNDIYSVDQAVLTGLASVASPSGCISASLWEDKESGRYFYSLSNGGEQVVLPSQIGIITQNIDFSCGAEYVPGEVRDVTDSYTLLSGKRRGKVEHSCREYSFVLKKDGALLTVVFRVYDDGAAYRYSLNSGAVVLGEASQSILPKSSTLWSYPQPNVTYEGTFIEYEPEEFAAYEGCFTTPTLVSAGNSWLLLTEASVFDHEECYCSSYFASEAGSTGLRWVFGNKQTEPVVMNSAFCTPWRAAIIGSELNTIVTSCLVNSLCEDCTENDLGWIKPGRLAWSWWSSTGDDPIDYAQQFEYIDFASENSWEYVCVDYGWVLWDDYKEKVRQLVLYAAERGVGIWLWYGVNNVGHSGTGAYPKYSLLDEDTIRAELSWAASIGVKGVKVDYYDSDDQLAMSQMRMCALAAAENRLMVLFHGCTNPGGESRTYPHVLSCEGVFGAEYYKWCEGPSSANIITYLFTRNAVASADFTPTALPVAGVKATHGFKLAETVYIESGLVHFAENVNVYEGFAGLELMNSMPVVWDETRLLEGMPGQYGTAARRCKEDWYVSALTVEPRAASVRLDFLEEGKEYKAYSYTTSAFDDGVEITVTVVRRGDELNFELGAEDGAVVKITAAPFEHVSEYERKYIYLEAEKALLGGSARVTDNPMTAQYSSGRATVRFIGCPDGDVTFSFDAPETGVYEVRLFYISGEPRRFMISVNEGCPVTTGSLCSGDWVTVSKTVLHLELTAGNNRIRLFNDRESAPDLDRIAVSRVRKG